MEMQIRPLEGNERLYSYSQSQQITMQTGLIGHLRMDFGSEGKNFYCSWFDERKDLKTDAFKQEFDAVINALRERKTFADKNGNEILEHDILKFDDGTSAEVVRLVNGSLGISDSNPDYLKNHPNTDEFFTPLPANGPSYGVRKIANAEVDLEHSPIPVNERSIPIGAVLSSRSAMSQFVYSHPKCSFGGNYTTEAGVRVNTKEYAYILRMNPNKGDYNLYCYCYKRGWLDQHLKRAERGIRFITPDYKELFRVADGDKVRIVDSVGESRDRTVRYIDDYHMELDGGVGGNLYHICEFAERMEANGCQQIIPLRKSLPDQCYSMLLDTGKIVILKKGETGYYPTDIPFASKEEAREIVDYQNSKLGVTRAQEEAMKAGSMFGFAVPAADPKNYNENGLPIRQKAKERDDR